MVSSRHWDRSPSERRLNDRGSAGQCWAFEKALRSEEEKPHQDMNLQQVKEVYICIYIYIHTLLYLYSLIYYIIHYKPNKIWRTMESPTPQKYITWDLD